MPGLGSFDIDGFLAAIDKTGFNGPVWVEIISGEQRQKSLEKGLGDAIEAGCPYPERVKKTAFA